MTPWFTWNIHVSFDGWMDTGGQSFHSLFSNSWKSWCFLKIPHLYIPSNYLPQSNLLSSQDRMESCSSCEHLSVLEDFTCFLALCIYVVCGWERRGLCLVRVREVRIRERNNKDRNNVSFVMPAVFCCFCCWFSCSSWKHDKKVEKGAVKSFSETPTGEPSLPTITMAFTF